MANTARAPYFQFYPEDFMHGCRMAGMSPEQVGAYIYMLCLEWLNRGPIKDDMRKLAMGMGWDIRLVKRLVNEVVGIGKYLRAEGKLSNERLEEEIAKFCHKYQQKEAAAAKELPANSAVGAAKLPGSYATATQHLSKKSNKNNVKGIFDLSKTAGDTRAQDPEAETEEKERTPHGPPKGDDELLRSEFDEFWAAYPAPPARKVGKGECLALFRQLVTGSRQPGDKTHRRKVKDLPRPTAAELIVAVKNYAAALTSTEYVPGPVVWLNQGRWLDDVCKRAGPEVPWWRDPERLGVLTPDRWREGIRKHANGTWPVDKLGPPPGHPECAVPKDIVSDLRLTEKYTDKGIKRP